jgi:aspartyl/asparaginyl-tRNA synthetase
MKGKLLIFVSLMLMASALSAQKAEVLYFKADLACCMARACDALENDVKAFVETNYNGQNVVFREIRISDHNNADLVAKHKARSQTVVVVAKKRNNETVVDISDIVRKYSRTRNKPEFETELLAKINECIK